MFDSEVASEVSQAWQFFRSQNYSESQIAVLLKAYIMAKYKQAESTW